jgi:serine/threonine-protein kinase
MSGPASEPLLPANDGATPAAPDSAPWSDTDLGLAEGTASSAAKKASVPPKQTVATDQLSTIGYIGRYALKYQIGEGGLGRVYAAHDPLLSRLIAIKTLNLEISPEERESFNAMFLNEARAAGGLSHPHIVTVFDAGVSEQGPYIAMELLRGRDLRQLRLEGWRPTPTQAALVIRRVADALAYAHSKGVVHRDIKPANIFMVGRTQPRVLDFGIARVAHHHDGQETDIVGGSPYYMSPEQVRHETVDRRCDVFSLGVVLYELLTDVRPFRGNSLSEITGAVLDHQPPPAHEVDPNVPKALSEIAAKAMMKSPEDRYSSARSLSRELRHWLEEHPQLDTDGAEADTSPRKKLVWGGAAIAALVLAAGGGWMLSNSSENVAPAVASAASAPKAIPAAASATLPPVISPVVPTADDPSATAATQQAAASAPLPEAATSGSNAVASAQATTGVVLTASTAMTSPPPPAAGPAKTPAKPVEVAKVPTLAPTPAPAQTPAPLPAPAATTSKPVAATTVAATTAATTAVPATAAPSAKTVKPADAAASKPAVPAKPVKETPKERRAREKAEREAKLAAGAAPAAVVMGVVRVAVSPWGHVEVDGKPAGTAPPVNELNLPEGRHTITLRNDEFPPFTATVNVTAGQPVNLKHRFGS